MHKTIRSGSFLALWISASAFAAPFEGANVEMGEKLHAEHCVACHAEKFDGNGAMMYLRSDHKIKSPSALSQQVTTCVTMLKLGWFPEEELDVAGYLNKEYYKFK
ncbi:MAG: cytochrome c [Rhodocyclaceae bacterium]|nr:cytochrome c [Rhodocyclaceae bacterium]